MRIRGCPAAVSGNESRQEALDPPARVCTERRTDVHQAILSLACSIICARKLRCDWHFSACDHRLIAEKLRVYLAGLSLCW
jgi:hypothetical protein